MIVPSRLRPHHTPVHPAVAALALVSVLLLSACAESEPTGAESTGEDVLSPAESPLTEYMGDLWSFDGAKLVAEQRAVEELVAQCMLDQGFDYTVPDVEAQLGDLASLDLADVGTREWITEHGYDIATRASAVVEDADATDPNAAYLETLSAASAAEYDRALFGDLFPPEDLSPEEVAAWTPQHPGCLGTSRASVTDPVIYSDTDYQDLMSESFDIQASVLDDPAVVTADRAWADCMADAGYERLASPAEARASIDTALDDLWTEAGDDAATTDDLDQAALTALRQLEIETALADDTCQLESGYRSVVLGLTFDAEERFIADHKAQLDDLLAEYAP